MAKSAEAWAFYENPITQTVLGWLGGDLSLNTVVYIYAVVVVLSIFLIVAFNSRNPLTPMILGGVSAALIGTMPVIVRVFVETGTTIANPDGAPTGPPTAEMAGHVPASIAVSWLLLTLGFWLLAVTATAWVTAISRRRLSRAGSPHVMVSAPAGQGKRRALELVRQLDTQQPDAEEPHRGDQQ